jgi:hypothetical protein
LETALPALFDPRKKDCFEIEDGCENSRSQQKHPVPEVCGVKIEMG